MEINYALEELPEIAKRIIAATKSKTLLFIGDLGAGKTTLIKEIVKQLGSKDRVSSPTFSLVNKYDTPFEPIYHFDFYRLQDEEEAYDMGFEEYVYSHAWKLIEWPQKIEHLLPVEKSVVTIKKAGQYKRLLTLKQ